MCGQRTQTVHCAARRKKALVFLHQHNRNHCVLFKLVETNEDMLFVLNGLFVWCRVFIRELYPEWTSKAH